MSQHNPTLTDLLRAVKAATELDIHCMMPGVIAAYDAGTGLATVQPSLNIKARAQPAAVPRAQVIAPVAFPTVSGFSIEYTPAPGDSCILLFSDRGLDAWTQSGGVVDPGENARHSIKDAIVLPFAVSSNSTRQKRIEITPAGDVTIEGTTTVKLGALAALAVNRTGDTVIPSAALTAWALVVETAINVLAPGTFTPANSFAGTVAAAFATTGPGSTKVKAE